MFLGSTITGASISEVACAKAPFGPGFQTEVVELANKLEVWHSSFADDGEDFTEFRLLNDTEEITSRRVRGY